MAGRALRRQAYRRRTYQTRPHHRWGLSPGSLLLHGPLQSRDLRVSEPSPSAGLQASELQRPETDSVERLDLVADEMQHAADLPVPAFANHDPDFSDSGIAAAPRGPQHLDLRPRAHPIALLDARPQTLDVGRAGAARHQCD